MPTPRNHETDAIDLIRLQWTAVHPDLDNSPMDVFARIHELSQAVSARVQQNFAGFGVSRADYDVLSALRRAPQGAGLAPSALLKLLLLSSAGLTGRLHRLEGLGLITRTPHPTDNRGVLVELTDEGRELVDQLVRADVELESRWLNSLSKRDTDALISILRTLRAAINT